MSLATVRTAIKTKLDAITGIENVYDYVYWTDDWQVVYDNFAKDSRINCWFIGLASRDPSVVSSGTVERQRVFNFFAYYSLKSSNQSSITLENLVDTVCNEFEESLSITTALTSDSIELISIESTLFAGTPAHRATIQFTCTEIIAQDLACSG